MTEMHSYQRSPHSGAGNCVCGAAERHMRHPHPFMLPAFVDTSNCCCSQPYWAECHRAGETPKETP